MPHEAGSKCWFPQSESDTAHRKTRSGAETVRRALLPGASLLDDFPERAFRVSASAIVKGLSAAQIGFSRISAQSAETRIGRRFLSATLPGARHVRSAINQI